MALGNRHEDSVGVVIPAYNAERFLAAAIESVLAQTHLPAQTIVVDDGSSDRTGAVARSFGPQVSCVHQANAGVAAARNRGVARLATEWIAFLDADDLWRPNKLERQLGAARQTAADAVFCAVDLIDAQGLPLPQLRMTETSLGIEPLIMHSREMPQATSSTTLVRRKLFKDVSGYDELLATMADWDLLIRLRLRGRFAYVGAPLVYYRRYDGTMSQSVAMLEEESQLVLKKAFASPEFTPQLSRLRRRAVAWNDLVLSGSHWGAGNLNKAVVFGLKALARDPRIVWYFLGLPVRSLRRRLG